MKRYVSVFEMIARSSIYKVLAIIGVMLVAQAVCFYLSMISPSGIGIESYIDQSQYSLIFKIAYVLITIVLVLHGMNLGSVQSYTLKRLRIKEKRIFWLQALYNLFAYVLLWGIQLMMILVSVTVYQKNLPEGVVLTNQTMFIAFYRNDFMHSILPLEDGPGWWVLALIGVTSAFVTAEFTKLQREGKFGFEILLMALAVIVSFPKQLGYEFTFLALVLVIIYMIMGMRWILNADGDGGEGS